MELFLLLRVIPERIRTIGPFYVFLIIISLFQRWLRGKGKGKKAFFWEKKGALFSINFVNPK